jgi:hypothetical protein
MNGEWGHIDGDGFAWSWLTTLSTTLSQINLVLPRDSPDIPRPNTMDRFRYSGSVVRCVVHFRCEGNSGIDETESKREEYVFVLF